MTECVKIVIYNWMCVEIVVCDWLRVEIVIFELLQSETKMKCMWKEGTC